ncbi:MAG: putative peptidase [Prokaryotic dsDNA virus sp.]|nr:MAG: putative peptidase [Prokaryotic dsDNA virus sp.]|tara:strand:+ start:5682 stop:6305 length:624 start_codon:yes stop_codon:yes gene_type:complete
MAKKKKKKKKYHKITELVISEDNKDLAIDAISLVTDPAIEVDFVYFDKSKNNLTLAKVDEEKRMLVSPALIPNKQIYRYDADTDQDYYVFFSKDTVRQASEMYLRYNNHHKATYQHESKVTGVVTIESWIKEGDMDKSKLYGFDLPDGTWFVKMKIDNEDMWNRIKEGELKGLSIEGYFVDKMEALSKPKFTDEEVLEALASILKIK